MDVVIVLAHPNPKSFNHAIAQTAMETLRKSAHRCFFHDLYKERFGPVLSSPEIYEDVAFDSDVEHYQTELVSARGIIVIHPNWWGQPPAILKGWVDRVLREDVAYRFKENDQGEGVPVGLLKAKSAVVFNTSNTPQGREVDIFGDPLETIWKNCIFNFCGVKDVYRETFGVMATSTLKQRKEWLQTVQAVVQSKFPADA